MTKTEQEIADLQARLTAAQARKTAEDAARAADTENVRELAVALHGLLCPLPHGPGPGNCEWALSQDPDDPTEADWTETWHALWLNRARLSIAKAREIGFTVTDPDE